MKNIRLCKKCGFILETRPDIKDIDGICMPCINSEKKKNINFKERQEWLTKYLQDNKSNAEYDCVVGVSGGKDSTTIVRKLFENHGVKKALLVHVNDHFTKTKAGISNLKNIIDKFNCDLIDIKFNPKELAFRMKEDFDKSLNPLKWLEEQIYAKPLEMANKFNIKIVFMGENSKFEYGSSNDLDIFHESSNETTKIIYMGAIYPYSNNEWYKCAKEIGFVDLNYYNEWQRQGCIDDFAQIDSIGYMMGIWTKFVKFGFQRVSDMACRFVREGILSKEAALTLIKEKDYICDPASKRDFCRTINITEEYFDEIVDKYANKDLVKKDINGIWRRKDLML